MDRELPNVMYLELPSATLAPGECHAVAVALALEHGRDFKPLKVVIDPMVLPSLILEGICVDLPSGMRRDLIDKLGLPLFGNGQFAIKDPPVSRVFRIWFRNGSDKDVHFRGFLFIDKVPELGALPPVPAGQAGDT